MPLLRYLKCLYRCLQVISLDMYFFIAFYGFIGRENQFHGPQPVHFISINSFSSFWFFILVINKNHSIKLRGFIDRLDFKDNMYRIIDYKTGEINSLHLNSIGELIEKADKKKEAFQLLFYWYLLKKTQGDNINYRLGIFHFKNIYI